MSFFKCGLVNGLLGGLLGFEEGGLGKVKAFLGCFGLGGWGPQGGW